MPQPRPARPARRVGVALAATLTIVLATLVSVSALTGGAAGAATDPGTGPAQLRTIGPVTQWMDSEYEGWNWAHPDRAFLYRTGEGDLGVVRLRNPDEPTEPRERIEIDVYDAATLEPVGTTRTVSFAGWPRWGGLYAAPDGTFYVLVGRDNPGKDDDLDVMAVRHYDAGWTLLGTAYLKGGASQGFSDNDGVRGVVVPFDAGHPRMLMVGDRLLVHTSRKMYSGHQGNLTFEVDPASMTARTFEEVGGGAAGSVVYSSHSFQQLVTIWGDDLVFVDHGDAYPRAVQLGVMADYPDQRSAETHEIFQFGGSWGENFTGASLTGIASGPSGVVVIGNSQQQTAPDTPLDADDGTRNVFAITADPATGTHQTHWLTDFAPRSGTTALEPRITQVAPDRFAVLFTVRTATADRLEYRLIDSGGDVLASATYPGVTYPTVGDPFLLGDVLYWVSIPANAGYDSTASLYGLRLTDPMSPPTALPTTDPPTTDPPTTDPTTTPMTPTTSEPTATEPPTNQPPAPQSLALAQRPAITGAARPGRKLRAGTGAWQPAPATTTYQWYRGSKPIPGATKASYKVKRKDAGKRLKVRVTAERPGYATAYALSKAVKVRR